ncbi:MAG: hypothetical protein KGD58_16535 [Candidatus Lokiarchaeota archaeon]|nr:hypothetical protein [Candidatus Lokiarchaeota archaeon]
MKKISYNLRIGIVGNKNYHEEVFLDNIKDFAIAFNILSPYSDFFLIYKQIPIKVKIFSAETLEEVINNFDEIEKLDVIILTVNLADTNSIHQYFKDIVEEFNELYYFQGISILVGIDIAQIFKEKILNDIRVSRYSLKDMASYLNLIYCYEIYNITRDVIEIYKKIFDDFVFRFSYSSPESFEQAKIYGNSLLKETKKMNLL